jgi:hypothetical protein
MVVVPRTAVDDGGDSTEGNTVTPGTSRIPAFVTGVTAVTANFKDMRKRGDTSALLPTAYNIGRTRHPTVIIVITVMECGNTWPGV